MLPAIPVRRNFAPPQRGEKILNTSKDHQVICISHLPQIAALADTHFLIDKTSNGNKTRTSIKKLEENERVEEMARILGGVDLTDTTLKHAREMIEMSKKIKSYLRKHQAVNHWKIGEEFQFMDTFQSLTSSIPMSPNIFLDFLLEEGMTRNNSRYGEQWKQLDYLVQGNHEDYLETVPYSDLSVFNLILDAVPDQSSLHLSNSSVIRYAQLFDPIKSINYFCNRGTSGIDGSTSTAIGNAIVGANQLHTFITGDISFFYDSNAFWNHHVPSNFRVFMINNGGGGIFNIIPGPQSTPNGDEFFVAKHSFSAKSICEAFNVNYYTAKSMEEIDQQLDQFYEIQSNDRPAVIEIFTDGELSGKILSDYFKATIAKEIPVLKS